MYTFNLDNILLDSTKNKVTMSPSQDASHLYDLQSKTKAFSDFDAKLPYLVIKEALEVSKCITGIFR